MKSSKMWRKWASSSSSASYGTTRVASVSVCFSGGGSGGRLGGDAHAEGRVAPGSGKTSLPSVADTADSPLLPVPKPSDAALNGCGAAKLGAGGGEKLGSGGDAN